MGRSLGGSMGHGGGDGGQGVGQLQVWVCAVCWGGACVCDGQLKRCG